MTVDAGEKKESARGRGENGDDMGRKSGGGKNA